MKVLFGILLCISCATAAFAQSASDLVANATSLNRYGQTLEGEARRSILLDVRRILDRVETEHPNSPEATVIGSGGSLGDLNVTALDAQLAGTTAPVAQGQVIQSLPPLTALPPLVGQPNIPLMPLDEKARLKAVQAALNAVGCEAGTPDGVMGRKTRRGHSAFLKEKGLPVEAYPIDSELFLNALHSATDEVVCETMPVVPLTPQIMAANWTYTARCGSNSRMPGERITGVLSLRHIGSNSFRGTLANSQGLRARVTGQLNGRRVSMEANFGFLFGRVQSVGTVADDAYVFYGRDSNGCRITGRLR